MPTAGWRARRLSLTCKGRSAKPNPPFMCRELGLCSRPTHRTPLHPFDDRGGAHAAADAQGDQRRGLVGALKLVEHGAEDHRTGRPERMAKRDRAAIDVDLVVVDFEGL